MKLISTKLLLALMLYTLLTLSSCRPASPYSGPLLGQWIFAEGTRGDPKHMSFSGEGIVAQVVFGDHSWFLTDKIEFFANGTVSSLSDTCKFWPDSTGKLRIDCGHGDGTIDYILNGPKLTFPSLGVTYKR